MVSYGKRNKQFRNGEKLDKSEAGNAEFQSASRSRSRQEVDDGNLA
jgi:hypothetical protein